MKTCIFCQLATRRAFARFTRDFQRCVPRISNFLMVFVILEHTVCFRCYIAAKTIAFPIECTFTYVTSSAIRVNGNKIRRNTGITGRFYGIT